MHNEVNHMKLLMGSSLWLLRGRVAQAWLQFQVQESDPLTEVPWCTSCVLWATHWTSLLSWVSYLQSIGSNSTWPGMLGRSHKIKQVRCLAESPVCRTYSLSATWLMALSPGEGHNCRHCWAVIILLHILHFFFTKSSIPGLCILYLGYTALGPATFQMSHHHWGNGFYTGQGNFQGLDSTRLRQWRSETAFHSYICRA